MQVRVVWESVHEGLVTNPFPPERRRSHAPRSQAASFDRPYHRPMIPTSRTSAPLRLRRLPDRVAATRAIDAAEAFRDLPGLALLESARPGRNARWTYLTADPVAVLESPAAGPDPFAVARRLVARLDRTRRRPGRRAAVPRRPRRLPRLRPRRDPRAPAGDRRRPTRTCRRCGWRSTTGSSPGTAGPATPGSAGGRSMATAAAWRGGSTTSMPGSTDARSRRAATAGRPRSPIEPARRSARASTARPTRPASSGSATTSPAATSTRRT